MAVFTCLVTACKCKSDSQPLSQLAPAIATESVDSGTNQESTNIEAVRVTTDEKAEYKHRQELQKEFLDAASWLAKETDDAEARQVSIFLNKNVVTCMNVGSKIVTLDKSNKNNPIALFIVTGNELDELPALQKIDAQNNYMAYFLPFRPTPLMVLKYNLQTAKIWKALVILHEGSHARRFYSLPSDAPPPTEIEYALDEVRAYELEQRLLNKLGGEKYAALVQKRLAELVQSESIPWSIEQVDSDRDFNAGFDSIFGATNESERSALWFVFNLEVVFKYIEQNLPDQELADHIKAETFLDLLHGRTTK